MNHYLSIMGTTATASISCRYTIDDYLSDVVLCLVVLACFVVCTLCPLFMGVGPKGGMR